MTAPAVPEFEFLRLVKQYGKAGTARRLHVTQRSVYERIRGIETRTGKVVPAPIYSGNQQIYRPADYPWEIHFDVPDGVVLIGSDAHYWPGLAYVAHRAFVRFAKGEFTDEPQAVIMNGDVFDGSQMSRHPPLGWENRPDVYAELEVGNERLSEIEQAVHRQCHLIWPAGNHDARFEKRLAQVAPELRKVDGVHLKDHFSHKWVPCYSAEINNDVFCIHAYKGGAHHAYNDTLHAGMTTVTGDKHALQVTRFTDKRGHRWGMDCGMLADPYGPQFEYALGKPRNHCSGFLVLTFKDGRLLWPEVVHVLDRNTISFRGQVHDIPIEEAPRSPKVPHAKAARAKAKGARRRSAGRRAATGRARRR
jgi:hypothetical protein